MAWGIEPTPTWMVAPSSMSDATWPAMRALHLADRRRRILGERLVHLDPAVDLGAVQHPVAEGARHPRVRLGDDERGAPGDGERVAHGHAEREIAAPIGRRGVDEHGVGRPRAAGAEQGHRVEVARGDEVHVAPRLGLGQARRGMPRGPPQLSRVGRRREGIVVEPQPAHERERSEAVGLPHDLAQEGGGIAAARRQQHLHAGREPAHGIGQRGSREGARHRARVYAARAAAPSGARGRLASGRGARRLRGVGVAAIQRDQPA